MMAKLYVREDTIVALGCTPWGAPTGRPRGRPVSTGKHTTDEAKLHEHRSRLRVLELDAIIRSGRTFKAAS